MSCDDRALRLTGLTIAVIINSTIVEAAAAEPARGRVEVIRTVPNQMVFDRTRVYVEAAKPVVLVLENVDIMPHNLVVAAPGSLVEIGMAAERMALESDAPARGFVPRSGRVLQATKLVQPGESARLSFDAPAKPGEYPYACTLPGHWRIMNGALVVVPRLADVPPERRNPPALPVAPGRRFVHRWVADELEPELRGLDRGRSYGRGKAMFAAAGCIQCHRVRGEGGDFGPDLGTIPARLAAGTLSRVDVLREVLEPSKVMDARYRPVVIATRDGGVVAGIVVSRDARTVRVAAGPQSPARDVPLADIVEESPAKVSLMPEGLLFTLSKEEILDLVAYVLAGGEERDRIFQK